MNRTEPHNSQAFAYLGKFCVACVTGVLGDVDRMSQSLRLFNDTLDEWLECQKKWLYLENIFMAPDIQRQLPNETKLFGTVDRQFKSILRITRDRPAALPVSRLQDLNVDTCEPELLQGRTEQCLSLGFQLYCTVSQLCCRVAQLEGLGVTPF